MYVIDIETVPQDGIENTFFAEWIAEKFPGEDKYKQIQRAGLYGEFGMVAAIAVSREDGYGVDSVTCKNIDEEREALLQLKEIIGSGSLIGHNVKGFDIPFLAKRYLFHGLRVPASLQTAGKKPWEITHVDTMELMRFGGAPNMSLRSACFLMGLGDPKAACSGSDVWTLFQAGEHEKIKAYCESDVYYTARLYQKLKELSM